MTNQTLIERLSSWYEGKRDRTVGGFYSKEVEDVIKAFSTPLPDDVAERVAWYRRQNDIYSWQFAAETADMLERLWREKEHQSRVYSENTSQLSQRIAELEDALEVEHTRWTKHISELEKKCDHLQERLDNAMEL